MKDSIKVGQIVYRRGRRDKDIEELTVSKVGNKYFYLDNRRNDKINIETLQYETPLFLFHN